MLIGGLVLFVALFCAIASVGQQVARLDRRLAKRYPLPEDDDDEEDDDHDYYGDD